MRQHIQEILKTREKKDPECRYEETSQLPERRYPDHRSTNL
jgi:hypothetical protein